MEERVQLGVLGPEEHERDTVRVQGEERVVREEPLVVGVDVRGPSLAPSARLCPL